MHAYAYDRKAEQVYHKSIKCMGVGCIIMSKCDQICKSIACHESVQVTQFTFLVLQVENRQNLGFVTLMSKNLSTNYCCHLQKVSISYQGEIILYLRAPQYT